MFPTRVATEDKQIAEKIGLDDRIDMSTRRDPYIKNGYCQQLGL